MVLIVPCNYHHFSDTYTTILLLHLYVNEFDQVMGLKSSELDFQEALGFSISSLHASLTQVLLKMVVYSLIN